MYRVCVFPLKCLPPGLTSLTYQAELTEAKTAYKFLVPSLSQSMSRPMDGEKHCDS